MLPDKTAPVADEALTFPVSLTDPVTEYVECAAVDVQEPEIAPDAVTTIDGQIPVSPPEIVTDQVPL